MEEELIRLYTWKKKITVGQVVIGGAVDIYHDTCGYVLLLYSATYSRSLCAKLVGFAVYPHTCPMPVHNIANTNAHIAHDNGTYNGKTTRAHSVYAILTSLTE